MFSCGGVRSSIVDHHGLGAWRVRSPVLHCIPRVKGSVQIISEGWEEVPSAGGAYVIVRSCCRGAPPSHSRLVLDPVDEVLQCDAISCATRK